MPHGRSPKLRDASLLALWNAGASRRLARTYAEMKYLGSRALRVREAREALRRAAHYRALSRVVLP